MNLLESLISNIDPMNNKKPFSNMEKENQTTLDFEYKLEYLKMDSEIPLFKYKLLILEKETNLLVQNKELSLEYKEKQMDKIIKKNKKLFLDMIDFIFKNPLKEKEFIINNNNGVITLQGNLGYLFNYFASQYGIDIEKTSAKISKINPKSLFINKNMNKEEFIEIFNKNYYMKNNEDSLI